MPQSPHHNQNPHVLVSVLTIAITLFVFGGWFADHIQKKSHAVLQKTEAIAEATSVKDIEENRPKLPDSLIAYIQKKRLEQQTGLTEPTEESLESFEAFEEQFGDEANRLINSRFKALAWDAGHDDSVSEEFKVPAGLEKIVDFWKHIFGIYTRDHVVFYNKENVGIVYSVLDFSDITNLPTNLRSFKSQMIAEEKARLKKILSKIAKRFDDTKKTRFRDLTDEEKRIAKLLLAEKDNINTKEKSLLKSLSNRRGFSHRIRQALRVSGKYMDEMRRIFKERGLPQELTMIPFVESAFHLSAYSHAGAAGVWQFIEQTGKRYLKIDEYVDERYDPILATYAAATHLRHEYKFLKSWPLTINAYNTGPGRMLKARKQLQTDNIATIIKKFRGRGYGFDSRNYFPEVLAALHVYNNRHHYFENADDFLDIESYEYVATPSNMNVKQLSRLSGLNLQDFGDFNLHIKPEVLNGYKFLPKGYLIKIKPSQKQDVLLAMQELHSENQLASHHIVERGDTLKKIAKRYDIQLEELASHNRLLPNQSIRKGQVIQLPGRGEAIELTLDKNPDRIVPDKIAPVF